MAASTCLHLLLTALVLSMLPRRLHAQAPGDAEARCTVDHDRPPTYPDTVRNLMDSYHYVTLLPGNGTGNPPLEGAVWNDRSFDGNDVTDSVSPTYWQQGAGGICRFQTRVCGYRQGWQDNWLFTQHIHQDLDYDPNTYNYPVKIQIELTYGTVSCRDRNGCKEYFFLHYYPTNDTKLPSTQGTGFMNTDNYEQFAEVTPPATSLTYTHRFTFTLPSDLTGFYIGIQDNGTCVGVSRLRVYRNNCKDMQSGLVLYPEVPAPASGTVDIPVQCVADSSSSDNVTCQSDGRWGPETPVCKCNDGYETTGTMCRACAAGSYKSAHVTECTECPAHSNSDTPAADICHCSRHHYRVKDDTKNPYNSKVEDATTPCTKAPDKPTSFEILDVTDTSMNVSWQRPHSDGGRQDVFYLVKLRSVLSSEESFIEQSVVVTEFNHTFTDLRPVTYYLVSVQAENGVSYQDDRVEMRLVELEISTAEGNPGPVSNQTAVDNVVLVWGPPAIPNGVITGYGIMLRFCKTEFDEDEGSGVDNETDLLSPEGETECETAIYAVDANTLYFVLNNDVLPDYEHNLTFSIRAKTGEDRYGVWSPEITIVPKIVCPRLPTIPPTTPPTCPPVECSTDTPTVKNTPAPSPQSTSCEVEECVLYMAYTAGAVILLTTLLCCLFSCSIACLCHKHKMKTYRINMKKQMQSKWEY